MNINLLYVVLNFSDFLETMFVRNNVEYKIIYDKNYDKFIYVKHYENKDSSEAFKNVVMSHIYLSELGNLTFVDSSIITPHKVSIIKNCNIKNVECFSIGEKYTVVHLKNGRKRQKEHSKFCHTMGYSTNTRLMFDDRDNLYIVSKYSGDNGCHY